MKTCRIKVNLDPCVKEGCFIFLYVSAEVYVKANRVLFLSVYCSSPPKSVRKETEFFPSAGYLSRCLKYKISKARPGALEFPYIGGRNPPPYSIYCFPGCLRKLNQKQSSSNSNYHCNMEHRHLKVVVQSTVP